MAITKAIKELLQKSSNNVPERVTSRGSNALRLKLVDGKSVTILNKSGEMTEYGKYWYNEVKKEALPRAGFDPETPIIRRQLTDYIALRNRQEAVSSTHVAHREGELHIHEYGSTILR